MQQYYYLKSSARIYLILELVHPLVNRIRSRWVWSRGKHYFVIAKLDPVKIRWIIREKEKGELANRSIAGRMGISERWVQRLWLMYRTTGIIPELKKPGRPRAAITDEERNVVKNVFMLYRVGACLLEGVVMLTHGIHIPHNRIHKIMKQEGIAMDESRKSNRRKWIRYERTYSNSLWHADWKQLKNERWLICYMDDASRFIVGYGVFKEATSKHVVEVLHQAIGNYGKPAAILTDRGTQFYASESEYREKGVTEFEDYIIKNDIRHILARVNHPQTNGKLERFYGEVQRKSHLFKDIHELIDWYNNIRPHMSLNLDVLETPSQAYARKMPKEGIVTDERSGEIYRAKEE